MSIFLALCLVLVSVQAVFAQFSIDSPLGGSVQSGTVAPPTGWRCNAGEITATIDNGPTINFTERQNRGDTAGPCSNNGDNAFIIAEPWNYNVFGSGQHTIRFFNDGSQFTSAIFEIATFGTEFLLGASACQTFQDFPDPGGDAEVCWDQAIQNFRITEVIEEGPPPVGLQALLGRWRFTYTIISTFTNIYDLQTITTVLGTEVISGEGEFGDVVIAGRIQDISPGNALSSEFALLDPGIILCRLFVFDQTSTNTVTGFYIGLFATSSGGCGSTIGSPDPMNGIRLSSPSFGKGSPVVQQAKEEAEQQELLAAKSGGVEPGTAAAIAELVGRMQQQ